MHFKLLPASTQATLKACRGLAFMVLSVAASCAVAASSTVQVRDATVRAPRPGFKASVVTMQIESRVAAHVVDASSDLVNRIALHRMVREGSEVRMDTVSSIPLVAHEPVSLQLGEGRFHLMATGWRRPLRSGERVAIRLVVEDDRTHVRRTVAVGATVTGTSSLANEQEEQLH
jgi:copper(I)-binding protein